MICCWASDCVHFHNGYCVLDKISISDDFHQCEDYVDYADTDEYKTEFWRAVIKDGKIYKRKDKGRRVEENGIVFYYWAKELEPETNIIEEKTGRMARYSKLNDISNAIQDILNEQGNVKDLTEWEAES